MAKKMPAAKFVAGLEAALNRRDGYIMGATGQNPKKWATGSWWFTQYSGSQRTKALYWRRNASRVWDCNGLAEGLYKDFAGVDINTRARYNYAQWCGVKGTGVIPPQYRVPGAAVFWGNTASGIHHVAFLYRPVDAKKPSGDWYLIEARGVNYGVVRTRLQSRKPNFWGWMTKYFDYGAGGIVDCPSPAGQDASLRVEITGGTVNVRRGPGTQYGILGVVKKGERLPWRGRTEANGWHRVQYGDREAWVSGRYGKVIGRELG